MLRLRWIALAAVAAVFASGNARAQDDGAMTTLRQYHDAIDRGDCIAAYALTSDAVIRRDPFPGEFRELLCSMLADWHRRNLHETLGVPRARLVDGWRRIVFVRAVRTGDEGPYRMTNDFDYIVHSSDGGLTWRVLDLSCVDERWIREIFPAYAGAPEVHAATARLTLR